jgi:hypothetical protein
MNANTIKCLFGGLVAGLAFAALSAPAHADFVATTASAGKAALPPSTVAPGPEYGEDEADAKDVDRLSLDAPEMELALLFLLIGDVPPVNLGLAPTGTVDPTPALPGGGISSGGPGGDTGTPSTTPEPAAWLLGVVGSALAGAASRLRRRYFDRVSLTAG